MNIEALQQLRRVVDEAPEELLHMRSVVETASCGTARCAIGWCIVDPWFQRNTKILKIFSPLATDITRFPNGLDKALTEMFDISVEDMENLFAGDLSCYYDSAHAVSKDEVLWNIDELLCGRHALPYSATQMENVPVCAGGVENPYYLYGRRDLPRSP